MTNLEQILILIIVALIYTLYKNYKKTKIYYNNYQQCLRVLADSDPKLAEYLRR